jgi:FMN phosphatase YigB (HAD superfamily)
MNKQIILFDIDYTLFNARLYRMRFTKKIQDLIGYTYDDFASIADEVYQDLRQSVAYFDPELFTEKLSKRVGIPIDSKKVEKIVLSEEIMEESLYEDTIEVLDFLAKQPYLTLGIFSAGLKRAQRAKIKRVEHFLHEDHIHIFAFKKHHALAEMLQQYNGQAITIIDDMVHILLEAKKLRPDLQTIWIQRPERSFMDNLVDNFQPDSIIRSLQELVPIIMKK